MSAVAVAAAAATEVALALKSGTSGVDFLLFLEVFGPIRGDLGLDVTYRFHLVQGC